MSLAQDEISQEILENFLKNHPNIIDLTLSIHNDDTTNNSQTISDGQTITATDLLPNLRRLRVLTQEDILPFICIDRKGDKHNHKITILT